MQTLNKLPGIHSYNIGAGLSKPLIRGLGFYRIVLAENGIKKEGQQWSAHHGLEIGQHLVESVEITKGPASLRYGSDAIGGVINILPDKLPEKKMFEGNISFLNKSNNEWLGITGKFGARFTDFFIKIGLTYNNYGDYKVPADSFEYKPNHYEEIKGFVRNWIGNTHRSRGRGINRICHWYDEKIT